MEEFFGFNLGLIRSEVPVLHSQPQPHATVNARMLFDFQ